MDITKRQITKIAREVNKFTIRTMRSEGIGTAEFDVLHAIRKNPGITQAGVCKITGHDKGAVARETANLESKGYINREDNDSDGRSKLLYATKKANKLKTSKAHIESAFYEWLIDQLPENDKADFSRILDVIYENCKKESLLDFANMEKVMKASNKDEE